MRGGHGSVETIGEQLLGYVEKGFTACKMRVGGMDHPDMVTGSAARVRAAREALGPGVQIMLDAHGSTGVADAINLARAVEKYEVAFFEEPAIYHNYQGMAEVRRATRIPIATGENLYSRFDFRNLGLAGGADIWQPDTAMTGGITEVLRIGALASALEVQMAPHVWGSALLWAASLQLAAVLPNYCLLEFGQTYNPLLFELTTHPVGVDKDGTVAIRLAPVSGSSWPQTSSSASRSIRACANVGPWSDSHRSRQTHLAGPTPPLRVGDDVGEADSCAAQRAGG